MPLRRPKSVSPCGAWICWCVSQGHAAVRTAATCAGRLGPGEAARESPQLFPERGPRNCSSHERRNSRVCSADDAGARVGSRRRCPRRIAGHQDLAAARTSRAGRAALGHSRIAGSRQFTSFADGGIMTGF